MHCVCTLFREEFEELLFISVKITASGASEGIQLVMVLCSQAWWPKFDPRNLWGGERASTSRSPSRTFKCSLWHVPHSCRKKKITEWNFQTNYNTPNCPLCVYGQWLRSLMQVFEWQGKRYDSRPPVCKEIALLNADGCGPAVFPPAEILLNLIECRRVHEPLQRNLISISVHLIS